MYIIENLICEGLPSPPLFYKSSPLIRITSSFLKVALAQLQVVSKLYLDRKICFHIGITLAVLYFASLKDIREAFSKFCVIIQRPQVVQQDKHLTFLRTKAQFAIVSLNNLVKAIYNYLFIITCPHPDFFKKKILQFRLSAIK